jgi:hypothetical protein
MLLESNGRRLQRAFEQSTTKLEYKTVASATSDVSAANFLKELLFASQLTTNSRPSGISKQQSLRVPTRGHDQHMVATLDPKLHRTAEFKRDDSDEGFANTHDAIMPPEAPSALDLISSSDPALYSRMIDLTPQLGPKVQSFNAANPGSEIKLFGKAEFMNPGMSHKDRIAKAMLTKAEARGDLVDDHGNKKNILAASSGNTGCSLALVAP